MTIMSEQKEKIYTYHSQATLNNLWILFRNRLLNDKVIMSEKTSQSYHYYIRAKQQNTVHMLFEQNLKSSAY